MFFFLFGRGRVSFFAVKAGGVFIFCCLGGGRFFCLLFGQGACYVFCCLGWACFFFVLYGRGTGVHSLTGLPGSSSSDPTTKKTKQQKNDTGSVLGDAGASNGVSPKKVDINPFALALL